MQCKLQQEQSVIGIFDTVFFIVFLIIISITFVNEIHICLYAK